MELLCEGNYIWLNTYLFQPPIPRAADDPWRTQRCRDPLLGLAPLLKPDNFPATFCVRRETAVQMACSSCVHGLEIFLPDHLERTMQAMARAKKQGIRICIFQVSGFYSTIALDDLEMLHQIRNGLANVEDLRLIDSPSLVNFFSEIHPANDVDVTIS